MALRPSPTLKGQFTPDPVELRTGHTKYDPNCLASPYANAVEWLY